MSNATQSKFWLLDSAGVVWRDRVFIKDISVTWKVSSAGTVDLTEVSPEKGIGVTFLYAQTLGATSAAQDQLTQIFIVNDWVQGLNVKTIGNVAKLIVHVG